MKSAIKFFRKKTEERMNKLIVMPLGRQWLVTPGSRYEELFISSDKEIALKKAKKLSTEQGLEGVEVIHKKDLVF